MRCVAVGKPNVKLVVISELVPSSRRHRHCTCRGRDVIAWLLFTDLPIEHLFCKLARCFASPLFSFFFFDSGLHLIYILAPRQRERRIRDHHFPPALSYLPSYTPKSEIMSGVIDFLQRVVFSSPPGEWALTQLRELLIGALKQGPVPQHVAFVMDGNRRWARTHRMETVEGHHRGFEALARVFHPPYTLPRIRY